MALATPPALRSLRSSQDATSNSSSPMPSINPNSSMPSRRGRRSKRSHIVESHLPIPPKAPHKPLTPYMKYSRQIWNLVRTSMPDLQLPNVGRITGQMWRELPDETKEQYFEDYQAEMVKYKEALDLYLSSPAYQAWLEAKATAQQATEEQADLEHSPSVANSDSTESLTGSQRSDGKVNIQPAEDEDAEAEGQHRSRSPASTTTQPAPVQHSQPFCARRQECLAPEHQASANATASKRTCQWNVES